MANSILIALDDSENAQKALEYVANNMNPSATVVIITILPKVSTACGMDSPSLTPLFNKNSQVFCTMEDVKRERMKEYVGEAEKRLVAAGFSPDNLKSRVEEQRSGVARDILQEIKEGKYDTVVLGRRGLSGVKEFFSGSVTTKVLQGATGVTVIVVD
ncbi:universal stress protein [Desulfatibacillum aliphaticivorans]|uniref:UspA domain protein n=1 Tax=Desulfatibacillum aliphaticivorans TaxID=218208 RepID=B8FKL7_DESAL|nr:universal stress protein [Desulfatibacillum aliphaticivorans]ACL01832.1 UspA domain protein [Desulfatibacillum aliphaticivorans]